VSLQRLSGFRMALLLLNRGDPGTAALKEARPVDSRACGGEKHSRSHGRPPFPVTMPHARTVLAFRSVQVLPKEDCFLQFTGRNRMWKNHLSIPDSVHTWRGFQDSGRWQALVKDPPTITKASPLLSVSESG
jgi:hypothetical protein